MKVWDRRFAVFVLAGIVALAAAPVQAMAAHAGRGSAHVERRAAQPGILPATLSFFYTLVEKAIAVVSPAPVPAGPQPPPGTLDGSRDNGAGIDPNGGL
ncbi:MAG TPA: hypothetical protein VGR07_02735 [Thermoanaerobaculia bacterium]|jgi:hypothetical protein|nr:hypothetical protein [Thermoanaerobaculia bacterium]